MRKRVFHLSKLTSLFAIMILAFLGAFSINMVWASEGSIAVSRGYPNNGETYQVVDHFSEQFSAVNTNTTLSVSIDGNTPIQMIYKGLVRENVSNASLALDWYAWEVTVNPILSPGVHTFQFMGHYYVWQETDQDWAEFNYYSDIHFFTISNSEPISSTSSSFNSTDSNTVAIPLEAGVLKVTQPMCSIGSAGTTSSHFGKDTAFLIGVCCAILGTMLVVKIAFTEVVERRKHI
jgi:hypothetical protein